MHELYRLLPNVDESLRNPLLQNLLVVHGRGELAAALRDVLQEMRHAIALGNLTSEQVVEKCNQLPSYIKTRIEERATPSLRKVINATGVPLHTNLGRAPLAKEALDAVIAVAKGYSTLEYDLAAGERGSRHDHVRLLLREITGAEDGMVVNNNAGAVLLVLSALAKNREVVVSRGQLVEVGGSFRIPDVMEQGGAILREVGTTNKTHPQDYVNAVSENTAAFLKVHTSNFRVVGFTSEVTSETMVSLAHQNHCLALEDLGSGVLIAGLGEPTVQDTVATGMDVVTFSGDKLLGGPQAGIIVGRMDLISKIRSHPLARALRVDKMTLAALEATLRLYRCDEVAKDRIPLLQMMTRDLSTLHNDALSLAKSINTLNGYVTEVVSCAAPVGGGSLPATEIPGYGVALVCKVGSAQLEARLRGARVPVVTRVVHDRVLLDPRTILPEDREELLLSLQEVLGKNEQ